jgi:hypothetical protein
MTKKNAECNIIKLNFSLESVKAIMPAVQRENGLVEVAAAVVHVGVE